MPKIAAIAASYRRHSYNKRIVAVAAAGARSAGADVTTVDLRDYPMSVYDNDVQESGFDENAARLQDVFAEQAKSSL